MHRRCRAAISVRNIRGSFQRNQNQTNLTAEKRQSGITKLKSFRIETLIIRAVEQVMHRNHYSLTGKIRARSRRAQSSMAHRFVEALFTHPKAFS